MICVLLFFLIRFDFFYFFRISLPLYFPSPSLLLLFSHLPFHFPPKLLHGLHIRFLAKTILFRIHPLIPIVPLSCSKQHSFFPQISPPPLSPFPPRLPFFRIKIVETDLVPPPTSSYLSPVPSFSLLSLLLSPPLSCLFHLHC